jgi:hypothetical protein
VQHHPALLSLLSIAGTLSEGAERKNQKEKHYKDPFFFFSISLFRLPLFLIFLSYPWAWTKIVQHVLVVTAIDFGIKMNAVRCLLAFIFRQIVDIQHSPVVLAHKTHHQVVVALNIQVPILVGDVPRCRKFRRVQLVREHPKHTCMLRGWVLGVKTVSEIQHSQSVCCVSKLVCSPKPKGACLHLYSLHKSSPA